MGAPQTNDPDGIMRGDCRKLSGGDRQRGIRIFSEGTAPKVVDSGELVRDCERLQGGSKKPSVGRFVLKIQPQSPDDFWRDEDFVPVTDETAELIVIDNA